MWTTSEIRSPFGRPAAVLVSLLSALAVLCGAGAAGAFAQTLPDTGLLPSGGVDVTTGPDGAKVGLDAGETGGVDLEAGPGGVNLGLRGPSTNPGSSSPPADAPGERVSTPGGPSTDAPRGGTSAPARPPARPQQGSAPGTGSDRGAASRPAGGAERGRAEAGTAPATIDRLRAAARRERADGGGRGVAPVFDLVERIPAAVRAGLVALALVALAMWALWVRGRRRLQHNAYKDPDTGVANMAAFEEILDREWQRAVRYRRPLALLLLDLEQTGGARRLLGLRGAQDAAEGIQCEVRESDTVARLAPSRFAVICPEAPQGSAETLGRAVELRLEESRLRSWAGVAEREDADATPSELVTRAAAALAQAQGRDFESEPPREAEVVAFPPAGRPAAVA